MASGQSSKNRKTSYSAKNTRKKNQSRSSASGAKRERQEYKAAVSDEIWLIVILALCILLLLSVFGLGGRAGDRIAYGFFGAVGVLAYALPFVLFIGFAFHISNRGSSLARIKITAAVFFLIMVVSMVTLYTPGFEGVSDIIDGFLESAASHTGGGIVGSAVCWLIYPAFGKIGSTVILVCIMLVTGVLVTGRGIFIRMGRAIMGRMRSWSASFGDYRSERAQERETKRAEKEAAEEEKRRKEKLAEENIARQRTKIKKTEETVLPDSEAPSGPEVSPAGADEVHAAQADAVTEKDTVKDKDTQADEDTGRIFVPEFIKGERINTTPSFADLSKDHPEDDTVVPEESEEKKLTVEDLKISIEGFETKEDSRRDYADEDEDDDDAVISMLSDLMDESSDGESHPVKGSIEELFDSDLDAAGTAGVSGTSEIAGATGIAGAAEAAGSAAAFAVSAAAVSSAGKKLYGTAADAIAGEEPVVPETKEIQKYEFPPLDLLVKGNKKAVTTESSLKETALKLQQTFDSFGVGVQVTNVSCGPAVTRYELTPEQGVKVSRIVSLSDDIKLNLAVADIRIEAPIPGKAAIGIEVPNSRKEMVRLRDLLESDKFAKMSSELTVAVGKDIGGQPVYADIEKMPHLLIAGATGSGKSVCINTIIMSLIYHCDPNDVKMIMIDPKVVELNIYNALPHLLIPVVTDPKKAAGALNWAVANMTERYNKFAEVGAKDLKSYNSRIGHMEDPEGKYEKMPQIVIIIDELADLMMVAQSEVEESICRLAQLARAAGIHLIIATQRPSVNVITGLIKANIPSRIAFAVSSGVDSRTILDMNGAEKLLGNGDMLFYPQGYQKPVRVQGAFVSEEEIGRVVDFIEKHSGTRTFSESINNAIDQGSITVGTAAVSPADDDRDIYFEEAGRFIIEKEKASIGMLQRVYKIGFNRAARIMDQLCEAGVVGPELGTKPRQILMTMEEFEEYLQSNR